MEAFFRKNGLTLALLALFLATWIGQFFVGFHTFNDDLQQHGMPVVSKGSYLLTGHFWESTFENWESEFLQMAVYVILTVFLYQQGSSESNPLPEEGIEEKSFPERYFVGRPVLRKLYENSLSLTLFLLFLFSFTGHLYSGLSEENLRRAISPARLPPLKMSEFAFEPEFWFQSLQNWQSEFLSVGVLVILTVYLRQKDSAQSKHVDAPHTLTED